MDFVPEGQVDSSQARGACVSMRRDPRPGGTVEVIVSPVVSPKDVCRRNSAHAALETLGIPGNSAQERPEPFPQLRVQRRSTLFGAENKMNMRAQKVLAMAGSYSGI